MRVVVKRGDMFFRPALDAKAILSNSIGLADAVEAIPIGRRRTKIMAGPTAGIAAFLHAAAEERPEHELLVVPQWQHGDWETFFSHSRRLNVARGNVLIQEDASERVIYFIASGLLEVTLALGGRNMETIAKVHPGSVVGELSFFDGRPRSAKVLAVADSELYRLDYDAFLQYADAHPRQACDLLLAIGRVVALRLRRTQTRGIR
jgi:CRP/FNR family transcriptional regulator, cyclic AMP receptor protein